MKKLILFILTIGIFAIFAACESDVTEPTVEFGKASFSSTPDGAQIWIDSKDTKTVTPDTVKMIEDGLRVVDLKLTGYRDTTFLIDVESGKTITVNHINLVKN